MIMGVYLVQISKSELLIMKQLTNNQESTLCSDIIKFKQPQPQPP